MGRPKFLLDRADLIEAIRKYEEGEDPPKNLPDLYARIAYELDAPLGSVIARIKEHGIAVRKNNNGKKGVKSGVLDLTRFEEAGIRVTGWGDILESEKKSPEENKKIDRAWQKLLTDLDNDKIN